MRKNKIDNLTSIQENVFSCRNTTDNATKIHEYLLKQNIKIERNRNSFSKEHVIDVLFDVRNLPM